MSTAITPQIIDQRFARIKEQIEREHFSAALGALLREVCGLASATFPEPSSLLPEYQMEVMARKATAIPTAPSSKKQPQTYYVARKGNCLAVHILLPFIHKNLSEKTAMYSYTILFDESRLDQVKVHPNFTGKLFYTEDDAEKQESVMQELHFRIACNGFKHAPRLQKYAIVEGKRKDPETKAKKIGYKVLFIEDPWKSDLKKLLEAAPALFKNEANVLTILTASLASLVDCHKRLNLVHRDLKPANILVREGDACVTDFGLSVVSGTSTGEDIAGTAAFYPPEIIDFLATGYGWSGTYYPSYDLFQFGVIAYHALNQIHKREQWPLFQQTQLGLYRVLKNPKLEPEKFFQDSYSLSTWRQQLQAFQSSGKSLKDYLHEKWKAEVRAFSAQVNKYMWLHPLVEFDPLKRGTSEQALAKLKAYAATRPKGAAAPMAVPAPAPAPAQGEDDLQTAAFKRIEKGPGYVENKKPQPGGGCALL